MKAEVKIVTPKMAEEMLKKNHNNRPISEKHVLILSNQMSEDKWLVTGEAIKLDKFGNVLDGQHRLSAIVKSGKPINIMVISDLDPEIFAVIDTGKTRTASDVLHINGIENSSQVAATIRTIIALDSNRILARGGKNPITNKEILSFSELNSAKLKRVYSEKSIFSKILPKTVCGALFYILSDFNEDQAKVFLNKIGTGLDIEKENPIYIVRQRLIQDAISKSKLKSEDKIALIIKAWNIYRQNKSCKVLKYDKRELNFPKPI